ncbi:UNVERIFIED_CONTAM: hypothetical protein FKN15_042226 [Acipenser sinensis]
MTAFYCLKSTKASPPKIKKIKNQVLQEGEKLTLKCEATGNPTLTYKWYRDGTELKKSPEIKIKSGRKNSRLQISSVKVADGGDYTCEVENILGKETMKTTISIQSTRVWARLEDLTEVEAVTITGVMAA